MHPRLAMNSLSTASWTLEQDLELYDELGATIAGWYLAKVAAAGGRRGVDLIADSGIGPVQVCTHGIPLDRPEQWPAEQGRLRAALDVAAELEAPWLGLTAGPAGTLGWDAAAEALGRVLEPIVEAGRSMGVGIAVEHSLPVRVEIGFVHSLRDCVDLAGRFGFGVVMESNYCFGERDLATTLARGVTSLATVQVSDLVPPSTTIPDRAVPGDGVIPLRELLTTVMGAGYLGPVEIEQLGPRIEAEGYAPALRRAVAVLDPILHDLLPQQ